MATDNGCTIDEILEELNEAHKGRWVTPSQYRRSVAAVKQDPDSFTKVDLRIAVDRALEA